MAKALEAVRKRGFSALAASKEFKIPPTTIRRKLKLEPDAPLETTKGPPTILSKVEEDSLVTWVLFMSRNGYPVTRQQVLDSVQIIVTRSKKVTPFTNGRPGKHWYYAFLQRHPQLRSRTCQSLTKRRANVTEFKIREWFTEVQDYLRSKNLLNICPTRIFNCDETAFLLSPKPTKVIAEKGQRAVYTRCNDDKECLTTLIMMNAKGQMPTGQIVFKGKKLPAHIGHHLPDSFSAGRSDNGWMTSETFYEYIANIFYPWCKANDIEFPIILFIDGHSSHLTMPLSDFCVTHNIELIALYPNATHLLQPLDVAFFKPLKEAWKKHVQDWRMEHNGDALRKEDFPKVLDSCIKKLDLPRLMNSAFKTCGLHPLDPDAVNYQKIPVSDVTSNNELSVAGPVDVDRSSNCSSGGLNVENYLPSEVLTQFHACLATGTWTGDLKYEELFKFWLFQNREHSNGETTITGMSTFVVTELHPDFNLGSR